MIILLGLLGAASSAPLLLNLKNAGLLPLQLQGPFNTLIPPFFGIIQQQQQAQIPGLSQVSLSTLDWFAGLFPNQIPFPRQVSFSQGTQMGQLDPSKPQAPLQSRQGLDRVLAYVFSFKLPQEQEQILQHYPVCMFLSLGQPQQAVIQSPQQTRQQQFEEQVILGGRQQFTFDPFVGTAPETVVMLSGGIIPYLQKEMINFRHPSGGIIMPSTSPKLSTIKEFASAIDPTITPELMQEKRKRCDNISDIILGYLLPQC